MVFDFLVWRQRLTSVLIMTSIVSNVTCFFCLRQLRLVCWSLDVESVKTLVHAFVASRVDYCNCVLASASKRITDKLESVLNAAARLITGTRKYERGLSRLMHDDLHWLTVPQRLQYKLAVTVHRSLQHWAPRYFTDVPVSESSMCSSQHVWKLCFFCRQTMPDDLLLTSKFEHFRRNLKNTPIHWTLGSVKAFGVFQHSITRPLRREPYYTVVFSQPYLVRTRLIICCSLASVVCGAMYCG